MDDVVLARGAQASPVVAQALEAALIQFLAPVVGWLDTQLDKRLVRTLVASIIALVASIIALVEWRNRAHGLLLSEVGAHICAYICAPAHAPAGTKRLSNLLRSPKWEANGLSACFLTRSEWALVSGKVGDGHACLPLRHRSDRRRMGAAAALATG